MKASHWKLLLTVILSPAIAPQLSSAQQAAAPPAYPAPLPSGPRTLPNPPVTDDGVLSVPAFELPFSSFASAEARDSFVRRLRSKAPVAVPDIKRQREISNERIRPALERMKALYRTTSTKEKIANVPVETFLPAEGVAPENRHRVLIQLHGGGGTAGGGGPTGAVESIPIAATARIKVIAVDYRLQPEFPWQAAVEDAVAVYRELLKTYRPENIGFYGCSAGGRLSGMTIPLILHEKLPVPGALGIFCASIAGRGGDSEQIWRRLGALGYSAVPAPPNPADPLTKDPMYTPAASLEVLKAFPPTLFITGTRATDMSGAAYSHRLLMEQGVKSNLVLYDGLDHGFHSDPTLPESQSVYRIVARFFAEHLGSRSR